jgi:hypothetical protein
MAMVFPTSPVVGQVFSSGGRSWVWNGATWDSPRTDNLQNIPSLVGGNTFTGNQVFNSGVVTTPNQPAFFVAAGASTAQGNTIIWNLVRTNIGSGVNTSNGRFTAPVAGTYYFGMAGIGNGVNAVTRTSVKVNGASIFADFQLRFNNNTEFSHASVSFVLTLAAGDYVSAVASTGITYSDDSGYMHFTGHLIG